MTGAYVEILLISKPDVRKKVIALAERHAQDRARSSPMNEERGQEVHVVDQCRHADFRSCRFLHQLLDRIDNNVRRLAEAAVHAEFDIRVQPLPAIDFSDDLRGKVMKFGMRLFERCVFGKCAVLGAFRIYPATKVAFAVRLKVVGIDRAIGMSEINVQ